MQPGAGRCVKVSQIREAVDKHGSPREGIASLCTLEQKTSYCCPGDGSSEKSYKTVTEPALFARNGTLNKRCAFKDTADFSPMAIMNQGCG